MGLCCSSNKNSNMHSLLESQTAETSSKSDRNHRRKSSPTKILLLGTGNSGKSTVFKQFQLVHNNGFSQEEREHYRDLIVASTVASIRRLLQYSHDLLFEGEEALHAGNLKASDIYLQFSKQVQKRKAESVETSEELLTLNELVESNTNNTRNEGGKETSGTASTGGGGDRASDLGYRHSEESRGDIQSSMGRSFTGEFAAVLETTKEQFTSNETILDYVKIIRSLPEDVQLYHTRTVTTKNVDGTTSESTITIAQLLQAVWKEPAIQFTYSMEGRMPSLEAPIAYYMTNIDRIADPKFMPTDEDMLNSRKQTRKVQQLSFSVQHRDFQLIDLGGQRIERRKWLQYFENVDVVIYIVGLDGYNQTCLEDGRTNRMKESLQLFRDICESPYFHSTSFLLFLNKSDLFKKKIESIPLRVCFHSYKGASEYDESLKYVSKRFLDIHARSVHKRPAASDIFVPKVYPYTTCATDSDQMKFVITSCQAIFLRQGMAACGIGAM